MMGIDDEQVSEQLVEALGGTGLRKERDAEEQRYQNRADAHEKSC